ncbi:MAG: type VII secretion protein EssB [Thomasclavelia sp.]|nr:type VII secretion protein EssB [Thomasclavelia sp.]
MNKENEIIKQYKKSQLSAKDDYDFSVIEKKEPFMLDCSIKRDGDDITITYDCGIRKPFTSIHEQSMTEKYQSLVNIQKLVEDNKSLKFSLNPENIYYDFNMIPAVLFRDIYENEEFNENDFVQQYKSLIGFTLQNTYSFEDYYQGGNSLLLNNKETAPFSNINDLDELVELLNNKYLNIRKSDREDYIKVKRNKNRLIKYGIRVGIVIIVVLSFLLGYFGIYRLNEEKTFNSASESYVEKDYNDVIDTLDDVKVSHMSVYIKYILAVSNVKAQSLSDKQKSNILSSVTLNSNEKILDFWIYLGKDNTDEAIDIAQQLGNDEYLAYAYMKEKDNIENDSSLSGEEKTTELEEVQKKIDELDLTDDSKSVNK